MRPPTVMKFGGTSVADARAIAGATAIVERVRRTTGIPPLMVVSAMAGVTDHLLSLARAAAARADVQGEIDAVWRRHMEAVNALVPAGEAGAASAALSPHFDELRALLGTTAILRAASPAALDAIASVGELACSRIVAAALRSAGVPSAWIDARATVVTDDRHAAASPDPAAIERAVTERIAPVIASGRVAVVGGFVGATPGGVTTTLGRGGSDLSAAILGAALGAGEIQIWTDVDGMLTADPRAVRNASIVTHLSFDEASELAYFGARVLHPSTILPAMVRDIPVRILNSRRPDGPGTLIVRCPPANPRPLAAVACKRHVTTIEITSTRMLMAHGFLRRVFEVFERHRTAVDVVTTSEVSVSVTIDDGREIEGIVTALRDCGEVRVEREMAIVSAVGDNLRADSRIAAAVVGALRGFALRMVSQAASRRNVTMVLRDEDAVAAMHRLHDEFFADPQASAGVGPPADEQAVVAPAAEAH